MALFEYNISGSFFGFGSPTLITTPPPPDIIVRIQLAQTFTPQITHTIETARLFLFRTGSPGNFTIDIYAVDGNSHPTGASLCSGTSNGDTLTTNTSGNGRDVDLGAGAVLTADIEYAMVLDTPNAVAGTSQISWMSASTGAYARGQAFSYPEEIDDETTAPNWWDINSDSDFKFAEYGIISPPTKAENPTPADEAVRVDFSALGLSWDDGGGADTFDVYMGPVGALVLVSSAQAGTTLTVDTGDVPWGETIYWRIDSTNDGGTTTGDTWSFDVVVIRSVKLGANGAFIVVAAKDGVYLSTDSGANWSRKTPDAVEDTDWEKGICSGDGTYIIVVSDADAIYRSANSGSSWAEITPAGGDTFSVNKMATSDDGQFMVIVGQNSTDATESCYISTDYGATWTAKKPVAASIEYTECDISNDGTVILVSTTEDFFISLDSGATWKEQGMASSAEVWEGLSISGDGTTGLVANTNDNDEFFIGINTELFSEATWAESTITSAGRALLDDATVADQNTTLGFGTGDSPTLTGLTLTGLTPTRLVQSGSALNSVADLTAWIAGTSNQIIVTDDEDGTVTLSAPQDIHTGASPTFDGLTSTGGIDLNIAGDNIISATNVGGTLHLGAGGRTDDLKIGVFGDIDAGRDLTVARDLYVGEDLSVLGISRLDGGIGIGTNPFATRPINIVGAINNEFLLEVVNTNNTGTFAVSGIIVKSSSSILDILSHGSGSTRTRFGETLANFNEVLSINAPLIVGTLGNNKLILGTNALPAIIIDGSTQDITIEKDLYVDGNVTAAGGNSIEWNTSYDNTVTDIAFNTGDGIITITQQDSGTLLTDSLDGRYYTETELGSIDNALGASLIGVEDAMSLYAATDVEAALEEVMDMITIETHVADSFEVGGGQVGTVTGIVENTQVINDGDELILNETTGGPNPNFVQTFEFSGITAGHEPNLIELHWYYSPATTPHTISVQMYNYNTSTWDVIDNTAFVATGGTLTFSSITITDGGSPIVDYTSGGVARVRFSHDDNGIAAHDFGIDYLAIKDDHGIGSGITDHGSLSGLQDDDHDPLYHTDGRAATWLAANHETTFTHADIATNTTHSGTTHDYAYISGNDGATNVTAAELEELTNSSNTSLHSHFVDRGDVAAEDYDEGDLTEDNVNWYDLDLGPGDKNIVPAGAKAVLLTVTVLDGTSTAWIKFRKNGNTNELNISRIRTTVADIRNTLDLIVACDANAIIEYQAREVVFDAVSITVRGWWL